VIDKRITPRFIRYERADLWLGIALVFIGAVAMIAFTAQVFSHHAEFGNFQDAGAVAREMAKYYGRLPAVLFAIALIDASIIGAMAVSLSTAYALGDVMSIKHSLHRKPGDAKGFYLMYCGLIALAAALVLIPGMPLGLLTNAVQTLAGILLPSATVFLLIMCNDKDVLGPWVNNRITNIFTAAIVAVLVLLSIVLTAAVAFPDMSGQTITDILIFGGLLALVVVIVVNVLHAREEADLGILPQETVTDRKAMYAWIMPDIDSLKPMLLSSRNKLWMMVLRIYLVLAVAMVIYKIGISAF
jgi:hypothetical protein